MKTAYFLRAAALAIASTGIVGAALAQLANGADRPDAIAGVPASHAPGGGALRTTSALLVPETPH